MHDAPVGKYLRCKSISFRALGYGAQLPGVVQSANFKLRGPTKTEKHIPVAHPSPHKHQGVTGNRHHLANHTLTALLTIIIIIMAASQSITRSSATTTTTAAADKNDNSSNYGSFLWGAATALSLVYAYTAVLQARQRRRQLELERNNDVSKETYSTNTTSTAGDPANHDENTNTRDVPAVAASSSFHDNSSNSSRGQLTSLIQPQPSQHVPLLDRPDLDLRLIRKAEAVIRSRTDKIVIVVERCTNDHNYSAILRTAEALGIQTVCLLDPPPATHVREDGTVHTMDDNDNDNNQEALEHDPSGNNNSANGTTTRKSVAMPVVRLSDSEKRAFEDHRKFAQNATEWLTIHEFSTATECITQLKREGYQVWVTDLSQEAVSLTAAGLQQAQAAAEALQQAAETAAQDESAAASESSSRSSCCCWPMPEKIALVVGTEAVGCSQEMLLGGDLRVYLPLAGFADSLNLSVATALVVQQLFHLSSSSCSCNNGNGYAGSMSEQGRHALRQQWFPKLAQQRLLSARGKKQRKALLKQIQLCERLQARFATPTEKRRSGDDDDDNEGVIQGSPSPEQLAKIAKLPAHREELRRLEDQSHFGLAAAAVADLVAHPPEPLTDLRRADPHRVTFVGKATKRLHAEHWKDMVAVTDTTTTLNATAAGFRERILAAGGGMPSDV